MRILWVIKASVLVEVGTTINLGFLPIKQYAWLFDVVFIFN